jgi:hypothetical protein
MISPADDPAAALLAGEGMTVRLVSGDAEWPGEPALPALVPAFELSRIADTGWGVGRAGMLYRDLLPSRQGGRFIASHIRIPDARHVPDEVTYHNIHFQLISASAVGCGSSTRARANPSCSTSATASSSHRASAIACWRAQAGWRSSRSPARQCTRRGSTRSCRCPRRSKTSTSRDRAIPQFRSGNFSDVAGDHRSIGEHRRVGHRHQCAQWIRGRLESGLPIRRG